MYQRGDILSVYSPMHDTHRAFEGYIAQFCPRPRVLSPEEEACALYM